MKVWFKTRKEARTFASKQKHFQLRDNGKENAYGFRWYVVSNTGMLVQ